MAGKTKKMVSKKPTTKKMANDCEKKMPKEMGKNTKKK